MDFIKLELMQDFSEIISYEETGLPLCIRTADLSSYPDMSAPCHWHDDIEWIHILSGVMQYYINGTRRTLREKDSLMVNTRRMHYGYSFGQEDCHFCCVLFHPSLFGDNQTLLQKYVSPVLDNVCLDYLHFDGQREQGRKAAKVLKQLAALKEQAAPGYEMEAIALLQILWSRLFRSGRLASAPVRHLPQGDLEIQRNMVSFVYKHYAEKITLEEIAASGHVSRSKCCRIFQEYLQQSPIAFLNAYRLKLCCHLLTNTDKTITEIALLCGFHHLSYFSGLFAGSYGCTPREYRLRTKR
ncbi:MAG: AraC family transcriptional regulator [Lachnospiraceae bacterium]|jgi:AraC-like DNA-binding protein|nr:AraC family transcriptional regulator [Lachnospiraceae bacterium]